MEPGLLWEDEDWRETKELLPSRPRLLEKKPAFSSKAQTWHWFARSLVSLFFSGLSVEGNVPMKRLLAQRAIFNPKGNGSQG